MAKHDENWSLSKLPHRRNFGTLLRANFFGNGKVRLEVLIFHGNVATTANLLQQYKWVSKVFVSQIEDVQLGVGEGRILVDFSVHFSQ